MKKGTFVYEGKLPSLNEVVSKNRTNRFAGASMKKAVDESLCWAIKEAFLEGKISTVKKPCVVWITFQEKNKRRDIDNIHSGTKFIMDALQKMGILPNDNVKWVTDIMHSVVYGETDKVFVTLYEGATFIVSVIENNQKKANWHLT